MATALVSGILLLGLAAFVVEDLIREWESRRWRRMAAVSYFSLGHLAAKMFAGIESLVTVEKASAVGLPSHIRDELIAVHEGREADGGGTSRDARRDLLSDLRWLKVARDVLATLEFEHRDAVARWIPSMLVDARLARVIEHVASLDAKRDLLEGSVIRLIKSQDPDYEDHAPPAAHPDAEINAALARWTDLEIELVATQETLMRAARHDEWRNEHGRGVLGTQYEGQIEDRIDLIRGVIE